MFDLKAGIDLQFTGLCLIKVNTATVVNCQSYQSPVKSSSTASCLRGTAFLMHPAQSWERVSESSGMWCFSDGVLLSASLLLTVVISLGECDSWPPRWRLFLSWGFLFQSFAIKANWSMLWFYDWIVWLSRIWGLSLIGSSVFVGGGRGRLWFNFPFTLYLGNAAKPLAQHQMFYCTLEIWLLQIKLSQTILYAFACCDINPSTL